MLGGRCQAATISFAPPQVDLAKADAEHKVVAADQIPEGWMVSMPFAAAVFGGLS